MTLSRFGFSLFLGAASLSLTPSAFAQKTTAEAAAETAPAPEAGPMDAKLRALYEAETEWRHKEFHLVKDDQRWVQGDRFASETAETHVFLGRPEPANRLFQRRSLPGLSWAHEGYPPLF